MVLRRPTIPQEDLTPAAAEEEAGGISLKGQYVQAGKGTQGFLGRSCVSTGSAAALRPRWEGTREKETNGGQERRGRKEGCAEETSQKEQIGEKSS